MALIKCGGGAGTPTFADIRDKFTVQDSAGQYNRIACTSDVSEYDYIVLTLTTAATGSLSTDMTTVMTNISGNVVTGVATNVQVGQYFGRTTVSGTTTLNYSVVGVKL